MTSHWLTWANALSAIRLCSIPALYFSLLHEDWWIAAVLFAVAVVTDFYDGKIARYLNQTSPLGGLMDHATDAMFVTTGCYALAELGSINAVLPVFIAAAFIQYMLDSKALSGQPLRTSRIGRLNGVAYFVLLGVAIGAALLRWEALTPVITVFAWLLVASSAASMVDRAATLIRLCRS